ncbi:MAG TPA: lytic murein transglycosylase [Xanthobacteraceae bacterium]|nr:lytic murein transglycosylase [Xanthobacteraceae bacterium]
MLRALALVLTLFALLPPDRAGAEPSFQTFLQSLWPDAAARGVARPIFESAIGGLAPDYTLPDLVIFGRPVRTEAGQPEFVLAPAEYLREATLARLAARGKKLAEQHRATLTKIENQFGVPPQVVLAIWGRETAFGGYQLPHDAVRALATQAYVGRRKDFFREEFLTVLKMLQDGIPRSRLRSSWGGALGLTQLLPTEFYKYGVDFDGDGQVDIWTSVPDALASAANQLAAKGWQRNRPWFMEVRVPPDTDCTIADPDTVRPIEQWMRAGFIPAHGGIMSADQLAQPASLLMPAGIYGPSFLVLKNFYVLKDYNFSDLYVLFVGHLAQRIAGERPFRVPWQPVAQLETGQLEEMQRRLAALGLYRDKVDGKSGMRTRLALGAYQKANGLKLDCWPSATVLSHMQDKSSAK